MPGIVVITACAALAKAPQPVPAALSDPGTADEPLSLAGKPAGNQRETRDRPRFPS